MVRKVIILLHLSKGVMKEHGWIYVWMNVQFQQPLANMTKSLVLLSSKLLPSFLCRVESGTALPAR
jgi:hypothetical protein